MPADDRVETKHESYGLLQISRVTSGGGAQLFGSSILHRNTIRLRVHEARHMRDLRHDWYYAQRELIEIEMSPAQFAEAITSLNCGAGVPCTIKHINHERREDPPYESKREVFREEFKKRGEKVASLLKEVVEQAEALAGAKAPNKGDRNRLLGTLGSIVQEISSNMPWMAECFDKHMEKSEVEAKAAIEAFILNAVTSTGLEVLRGQTPIALSLEDETHED